MNPPHEPLAVASARPRHRMLLVDPELARVRSGHVDELPELLREHDLLVLNDAATLPASLAAQTRAGAPIELRLLGPEQDGVFGAVLFGAGDYRTRTEDRPPPPSLMVGERLEVGPLSAEIVRVSELSSRLVELRFGARSETLWTALYAWGTPVQYADQPLPLPLWSVQTLYATRPWAAEMPSAGRPLSMRTLERLARRGVRIALLTHAAGLSATGDPAIDRALPLPERYDIPAPTIAAIQRARERGGRVIAVGTSVVRALEDSALRAGGHPLAGVAVAALRIGPEHGLRVVDGLLTGIHAPGESHFALLRAFADEALLEESHRRARALGYREHEFGDSSLVLPGVLAAQGGGRRAA